MTGRQRPPFQPTELSLRDGSLVIVRPMTRDDAGLELDFVENLSDQSRYHRFFQHFQTLPPSMLRRLTTLDYVNTMAIIATLCRDEAEVQVGVARYAIAKPGTCEFAVVVADQWQGKGLATELMHLLIAVAHGNGFTEMTGDILADNTGMLELARQLGFALQPSDPGVISASLALDH